MGQGKWLRRLGKLLLLISLCLGTYPAAAGAPPAGRLILVQGEVQVRRAGAMQWEPARLHQELYEGDALRTGSASQAAVLCIDESQVRLNERTLLILKSVAPSPRLRPAEVTPAAPKAPATSIYQVPQGEIWLRNKREKFQFELETPAATATIRGTEINIRVGQDGAARVTLLEGSICLANAYGEVCLRPGEEGFVVPGQAPTKQVLVQPADAVQWSLYYPGIFSFRDLPLTPQTGETRPPANTSPNLAAQVQDGERAYDDGRLEEAQQKAEAILAQNPDNGRALTLLGWIALQKHVPEEALGYFRRVRQVDERAIIGLALTRYRLGDSAGALETMQMAYRLPPNPLLVSMASYFALLAGKVGQARAALEAISRQGTSYGLPHALLAQIYLIQNNKAAAQAQAATALSESPNSPLALLTMGLVKMASFDLPGAIQYLEKATAADPRFVDAYLYLTRIWLGSENLSRAQKTIARALRLAPHEGTVLSLAGFVRLAYRDYDGAKKLWDAAVKANPRLGEPHLGLAIYQFRHRNYPQGLEEMLTATLLEPRVSLYQSELGKALYQSRSFDRALEVWDYAKTLDPKDPTPYLYKGIALSDLNRPGEAIQEINKSIELNDNVAMFRARQSLDQDRAVRNFNLARAYQQLGLGEWAFSKAVDAVKSDPLNSGAHLFVLSGYLSSGPSFFSPGQLVAARQTENALYRVLSPANQNTYSNLFFGNANLGLTFDYTSMYEMPYARLLAQGGVGAWEGKQFIQDQRGMAYGGMPGAAFAVGGGYFDDQGPGPGARNDQFRQWDVFASAKWSPTVQGVLTGTYSYADQLSGDRGTLADINAVVWPSLRREVRIGSYEIAYLHRFNPKFAVLGYYQYADFPDRTSFRFLDPLFGPGGVFIADDWAFHNAQLQSQFVLGNHTFIGGFDYFYNNVHDRYNLFLDIFGPIFALDFRPPNWSYSFYLLDYWKATPNLTVELGLFKDTSKNVRLVHPGNIYNSLWSPRVGLNYWFTVNGTLQTLRFSLLRALSTHYLTQPLLVPSEVAGFPWVIDAPGGSEIRQVGAAWESQWDAKTFTTLRLDALRVAIPDLVANPDGTFPSARFFQTWKRYQASFTLNRILLPSLGLSLGIKGKRVDPDQIFDPALSDFSEIDYFMGLNFLHRDGWLAGVRGTLVQQFLDRRRDNLFGLINLRLGRELPNKRGLVTFEVENLLDRAFIHTLEPTRDPEFFPARRYLFRLALYF